MKAVVFNLGCKVNQYESDVIAEQLRKVGYEVSEDLSYADVFVLNTCAVTAEAEKKSRQAVSRCRALNPDAKIFVCGCASEKNPTSFEKNNVVFVSGVAAKDKIIDHINDENITLDVESLPLRYEDAFLTEADRTRAYVKIQDGCNSFCSYCVIPYLRGRSRSRAVDSVVNEVKELSSKTKEIVLTGINIMSYGSDIGTDLTELIKSLAPFDIRIRIGSFYAEGISERLLDAVFSLKKFCPHFHLSLQSGDNDVLRAMNRHYTAEDYAQKIEFIRRYDNNACITTDVICGFPTETDTCHNNSVAFIKDTAFSDIHVFPFSAREGTRAYGMKPIAPEVIRARKNELLDLKEDLRTAYLKKNIGIKQSVLIEEEGDYNCGYSQYYIRVYTKRTGEAICYPNEIYKDGLKED